MDELNPTSKIIRKPAVNGAAAKKARADQDKTQSGGVADRVTLSSASRAESAKTGEPETARDIRLDLVKKFRSVLQDGSYVVKANEIADKIVQKIGEDKNPIIL